MENRPRPPATPVSKRKVHTLGIGSRERRRRKVKILVSESTWILGYQGRCTCSQLELDIFGGSLNIISGAVAGPAWPWKKKYKLKTKLLEIFLLSSRPRRARVSSLSWMAGMSSQGIFHGIHLSDSCWHMNHQNIMYIVLSLAVYLCQHGSLSVTPW